MFRYQDSFLAAVYQTPQYVQNNQLLLPPPPHYSSHFLEDSRICNPSQPCFMAKQTAANSQAAAETFNSANGHGSQQLPYNFGSDPRALTSQTSSPKLNLPGEYTLKYKLLAFSRSFSFYRRLSTLFIQMLTP